MTQERVAYLRGVLAGDPKRIFRVLDLGDIEDLLALEAQNKRLREALRHALLFVEIWREPAGEQLAAEIQALLAEPQPAATQQPKGGGE